MMPGYSDTWCGVCDETTEHIGTQCAVCQCATPLCPDCEEPMTLEADDDDDGNYLNWSCYKCLVDYDRRSFPVPAHILAQHRTAIADDARRQTKADERARVEAWNTVMRGMQ